MGATTAGELRVSSALADGGSSNADELVALLEAREAEKLTRGVKVDTWPGVGRVTDSGGDTDRVLLAAMSDTNIDANASDRMLPLWASGKS